jgi:chromosome segregation ATPase
MEYTTAKSKLENIIEFDKRRLSENQAQLLKIQNLIVGLRKDRSDYNAKKETLENDIKVKNEQLCELNAGLSNSRQELKDQNSIVDQCKKKIQQLEQENELIAKQKGKLVN